MRQIGAAAVVGQGPEGIVETHVPVEIDSGDQPNGILRCNFARPNPHADTIASGQELLLIFQDPHGYVTPCWYPSKHRTGKAVPTWNYIAIHAYGTAETFDHPDKLIAHLSTLTGHFGSPYVVPWSVDDAPDGFIDGLCRAIVGIEIQMTRLEGKWTPSQNKSPSDAFGDVNGLRAEDT